MAHRKKGRREPILKRRGAIREPNMELYVFTEGTVTEVDYLKRFAADVGNRLVYLEVVGSGYDPRRLVDKAVEFKRDRQRASRKRRNSFEGIFCVAAIFDIDEHCGIANAKCKARDNNIAIGVSNPCFELWGLLHFEMHSAPLHRHDAQKRLSELMPGFDHEKSPRMDYSYMSLHYEEAREHAERTMRDREQEDDPEGNPSTTVHKVLDEVRKNGVKK